MMTTMMIATVSTIVGRWMGLMLMVRMMVMLVDVFGVYSKMLRDCLNLLAKMIEQLLVRSPGFLAVLFHLHCLLLGFSFRIHRDILSMGWKFRDREIRVKKVLDNQSCELAVVDEYRNSRGSSDDKRSHENEIQMTTRIAIGTRGQTA